MNMSLPESGVLSAIVSVLDRNDREPDTDDEVRLHLGGLDSSDGLHPQWGDFDLVPGDEVTISVFDDRASDPPIERRGMTETESEERKKQYLRGMARELGWDLIENE